MKRIVIFISILQIVMLSLDAQNEYDALLVSRNLTSGTARSLSMSGSFGALGGDFSVASTNPAGLAVYRNPVLTITPGIYYAISKTDFSGTSNEDYNYKLTLDNIGYVWSSNNGGKTGWVGTAFGIGYNKLKDFNQNILIGPINANSSLINFYTDVLNGYIDDLEPSEYYEWLAWDTYLIDTLPGGTTYYNNFEGTSYGQLQEKSITRKGNIGEYNISFAANYSNVLYIGGSLGIQSVTFSEKTNHYDNFDIIANINSFNFRENFDINGYGYNLKIGILAKPVEFVRIGAAFHSPTTLNLDYNFNTNMSSVILFDDGSLERFSNSSPDEHYKSKTITPLKGLFSLGFVLSKYGLLNIDYEYVDYTKLRLRADDYSFSNENTAIKDIYQSVNNIKIGGEFNLGALALRAGYGIYGDPFKSSHLNSGQNINTISGGIGIRSDDYFFDLGIMQYNLKENHVLYDDLASNIETNYVKILATIGFKF